MNFKTTLTAGVICAGLFSQCAQATIVKLETNVGDLYINLYDETTPTTVNNFLSYVNSGRYDNTFIHRSVPDFVVQGGGFQYGTGPTLDAIEADASINNEAKLSNVRGTISMAKLSGQPNSATSQWFINLENNTSGGANLDAAESGYSVFGELTDESMVLIDQVAAYGIFDIRNQYSNGALGTVPLKDYSQNSLDDNILPDENNFIIIHSATVSDAATDTASGLNPPANPNFNTNTGSTDNTSSSSGGGGNMGLFTLLSLGLVGFIRRRFI